MKFDRKYAKHKKKHRKAKLVINFIEFPQEYIARNKQVLRDSSKKNSKFISLFRILSNR
jgi:hypothetical protein